MYKTEWIWEGSSNCCLNFALHYNSNYWIGILPMVFCTHPLSMVFWPPYPWYIDPPTHGILTPYPWNIDPPTHDILTSLPISWLEMGGQNTMGVQFTIQGGSVFNKGVQYTMDKNWPRGQFTMGFKIPYDTGLFRPKTMKLKLAAYPLTHVVLRSKSKDWLAWKGMTCLPVKYCSNELALSKSN
jgi:hypothetical protein